MSVNQATAAVLTIAMETDLVAMHVFAVQIVCACVCVGFGGRAKRTLNTEVTAAGVYILLGREKCTEKMNGRMPTIYARNIEL